MIYLLTSDFVRLNETTGTVQNGGNAAVEISNTQTPGTGITLLRNEKFSYSNMILYARCEGSHGSCRVVPFAMVGGSSSGGGSSGGGSTNFNDPIEEMWNEDSTSRPNFDDVTDDIYNP